MCLVCGEKLEVGGLSKEEHHQLHSYCKQLLEEMSNSFHDNRQEVEEVETFCEMLAREGPFTAVLDGLNLSIQGGKMRGTKVDRQ